MAIVIWTCKKKNRHKEKYKKYWATRTTSSSIKFWYQKYKTIDAKSERVIQLLKNRLHCLFPGIIQIKAQIRIH